MSGENENTIDEADYEDQAVEDVTVEDEIEDDVTEQTNPHYEILSIGADIDVEELVYQFDAGDIYHPNYQRKYVWSKKQASRLIESILIGLPIPSIFFYKDSKKNRLIVIDGFQRLTALAAFKNGKWPDTDQVFSLTGLPETHDLYKKTYDQLNDEKKDIFNNAIIHYFTIEQTSDDNDHSAAFHIFERLNSGGTPLKPQEMRNALYEGKFREQLHKLSQDQCWITIFDADRKDKHAKGQELILRFLALQNNIGDYNSPMKLFLNDFMNTHKDANEEELGTFAHQFLDTLTRVYDALGTSTFKAKGKAFNASYFDAFMVAIASLPDVKSPAIKIAYDKILQNNCFKELASSGKTLRTTDKEAINKRITMVKDAINASN